MRTFLNEAFEYIRNNNQNAAYDNFYTVYNHAVSCAVEAIQVAAMCKKRIDERADNGTAEITYNGTYIGKDTGKVFRCSACRHDFVTTEHPWYCPKCGSEFSNVRKF